MHAWIQVSMLTEVWHTLMELTVELKQCWGWCNTQSNRRVRIQEWVFYWAFGTLWWIGCWVMVVLRSYWVVRSARAILNCWFGILEHDLYNSGWGCVRLKVFSYSNGFGTNTRWGLWLRLLSVRSIWLNWGLWANGVLYKVDIITLFGLILTSMSFGYLRTPGKTTGHWVFFSVPEDCWLPIVRFWGFCVSLLTWSVAF